jgi:hypothetical protein
MTTPSLDLFYSHLDGQPFREPHYYYPLLQLPRAPHAYALFSYHRILASVKAPKLLSNMGTAFLCFDAHTTLHYVFGNFLLFNFYCFGPSQDDREHASKRARDGRMLLMLQCRLDFCSRFGP